MKQKEIKTCKFVNRQLNKTYKEHIRYNKNKYYTLKLICYKKENKEFKYYFELDKDNIPIYKRGLNTVEPFIFHTGLYNILLNYMKKSTFQFCTLNTNKDHSGVFTIFFKNNFKIEITYNNVCDKLFFEDLFNNYKTYIIEDEIEKKLNRK